MIRVAALDLSLTSTGVARYVTGQTPTVQRVTSRPTTDDIPARSIRLRTLTQTVVGLCVGADLVVIEGPSFGSRDGHAHDRSGYFWLVCARLTGLGLPVVEIPPTTLKKYVTGKGNTPKDGCLAAVIRRFPDVNVTGNDEADALGLLAMACRYLGEPSGRKMVEEDAADQLDALVERDEDGEPVGIWDGSTEAEGNVAPLFKDA